MGWSYIAHFSDKLQYLLVTGEHSWLKGPLHNFGCVVAFMARAALSQRMSTVEILKLGNLHIHGELNISLIKNTLSEKPTAIILIGERELFL